MAGGDAAARSGVSKKASNFWDEGRGDLLPESFYKLSNESQGQRSGCLGDLLGMKFMKNYILSYMDVSENSGTPQSSISIGFSIIFTIHFGVFPFFWKLPYGDYL